MLITPRFHLFLLPVLIQYLKDYLQICIDENGKNNTLGLQNFIDLLNKNITVLESAYAYDKNSPQSLLLVHSDDMRDRALIGIRTVLEGMCLHYDANIAAAAQRLLASFDSFGKQIHKMAYNIETVKVDALVNSFTTDAAHIADCTTVNITNWINFLGDTNKDFNKISLDRIAAFAQKPTQSATELKKPAQTSFAVLEQQISSNSNPQIDTTGKFATLVNKLNVLTTGVNAAAARHATVMSNSGGGNVPPVNP